MKLLLTIAAIGAALLWPLTLANAATVTISQTLGHLADILGALS